VRQSRGAEKKLSPPETTNAIDVNMGTLCERNACIHFIKQLQIGISILFRHELFLSLLSIKEEFSLNVGYSDVFYFVILLYSLKQTPPCEVCGSGNRMSR